MVDQLLEQHRRAVVVDRDVAVDRVHALADADLGGEVDDRVDPFQRLQDGGLVADVAGDELDLRSAGRPGVFGPVDLLDQAVEHPHLMAALKQRTRHIAADEARPAGDENPLSQRLVSRFNGRDRVSRRRSRRAASCRRPSGPSWRACRAAISLTILAARLTPRG